MRRWSVGDTEIVRVDASNFTLPSTDAMPAWAVPAFTPSFDQAPIAFSALAIRSGDLRVVADPWIVDDSPRHRPDATEVVDGLLAELADAGFPADGVDVVVCSHLDGIGWLTRPDGDGWTPTFPNARYLLAVDEHAAIERGVEVFGADVVPWLRDAGVLDLIDLPHALDARVTLVPAPGHNWGHLAVRIDDGDAVAIYPGHLVLSLLQVDDPDRDLGDTVHDEASATRRRLLDELADRHGLLLTTLVGGPGGGLVERNDRGGYRLVAEPSDG